MAKTDDQIHQECMQGFIELANSMKDAGIASRVVSAGMMTASAVYATYAAAGNEGRLTPSGTEKLAKAYHRQLDQVQRAKENEEKKANKTDNA